MKSVLLGVCLSVLFSSVGFAGSPKEKGNDNGNGGNIEEIVAAELEQRQEAVKLESAKVQTSVAKDLVKKTVLAFDKLDKEAFPEISEVALKEAAQTVTIKVVLDKLYVDGREVDAKSDPDTGVIKINLDRWNAKTDVVLRATLLFHELCRILRVEVTDKDYHVTIYFLRNTNKSLYASAALYGVQLRELAKSFRPIQAGSFVMGSPLTEVGRYTDEQQHHVTIDHNFEMQETEVTQAQWFEIMGTNPSSFTDSKSCPTTWMKVGDLPLCPNNPVEQVSWNSVAGGGGFLDKLKERLQDGYSYSLPTEEEWEYAARAGTTGSYSFGDSNSRLREYAWFEGNSDGHTHEVATRKANNWGLYDMHGNAWEWVADRGVLRGGSWDYNSQYLRSAYRSHFYSPDGRNNRVGFRLLRTR